MFDELHDPDPPTPGLHEFAAVAERAQQIRRRRNTWMVRAASLVVLAGVALAWTQLADRTALAPPPHRPLSAATRSGRDGWVGALALPEANGSTRCPRSGWVRACSPVNPDPIVELFEDENGGVCTKIDSVVVPDSCAQRGPASTRRRGRAAR